MSASRAFVVTAVSTAFALGFAAHAVAQQVAATDRGLVASHSELTKFDMAFGRTAAGLPRRPDRIEEAREHVIVPDHHGDLVTITPHGDQVVLWFKGPRGLRNVVLDRVTTHLWNVERGSAAVVETDVLK